MSKKSVHRNHISYTILSDTREEITPAEIVQRRNIPKQNVNYWLKKLKEEGLVSSPFHGYYEITDSGKTILDTYNQQFDKNLIRLENMRYKFPIYEGVQRFSDIVNDRWEKNIAMKNVDVYHTKIEGYSVSAYIGKNPSLTINSIKRVGLDVYEIMYEARKDVELIAEIIEKDFLIKLGKMETIMKPEWAIPSEFAKVLLNKTNSSQIKTPQGVINKSKDRSYDIETRDIRLANKLFNLPYVMDEVLLHVKSLRVASNTGWFCF